MYSPTLDEFQKLAAQGNSIPVTRRPVEGGGFKIIEPQLQKPEQIDERRIEGQKHEFPSLRF